MAKGKKNSVSSGGKHKHGMLKKEHNNEAKKNLDSKEKRKVAA